jgi:LuxR family maltose regulon positive regulatory protein
LLAEQGNFAQALQVIDNLLHVTDNAGAKWHWLRLKIIQAKIFKGQKNQEKAVQALEETLGIARLEGFVRSFLDEGESVAQLLYLTAQNGIYPDYCQKLLDEFSKEIPITFNHLEKYENLVEPLTERELEVLQRIAHGCSNQEIAQELIISLYTVKSHARNIFGKLGVKNRTEAVSKARLYRLLLEE